MSVPPRKGTEYLVISAKRTSDWKANWKIIWNMNRKSKELIMHHVICVIRPLQPWDHWSFTRRVTSPNSCPATIVTSFSLDARKWHPIRKYTLKTRNINVINAKSFSSETQNERATWECTEVRKYINVFSVINHLVKLHTLRRTWTTMLVWEYSLVNIVRNYSHNHLTWIFTKEHSTEVSNHTNVSIAARNSVIFSAFKVTQEYTQERNPTNATSVKKPSTRCMC